MRRPRLSDAGFKGAPRDRTAGVPALMQDSAAALALLALLALLPTGPAGASDLPPEDLDENPVLVCPDGSPGENCEREDVMTASEFGADYAEIIETRCLYRTKAPCRPIAHGRIVGARFGKPLIWQHMVLTPSDGPVTQMLVIAEADRGETPYLLAARQTDGWFAPPMLLENGSEGMLLHARGHRGGIGSGRPDIVLSRHVQGWTTFSITDLLNEAAPSMPRGFEFARGAMVDLSEMTITVPVNHAGDADCCPTGGTALIDLDMPDGNMIRVSRIVFVETRPVATLALTPGETQAGEPE